MSTAEPVFSFAKLFPVSTAKMLEVIAEVTLLMQSGQVRIGSYGLHTFHDRLLTLLDLWHPIYQQFDIRHHPDVAHAVLCKQLHRYMFLFRTLEDLNLHQINAVALCSKMGIVSVVLGYIQEEIERDY